MFLLLLSFISCCLAKERGSLVRVFREAEVEHNIPAIIPILESSAEDEEQPGGGHTHELGAPWQDNETGMWICPTGSDKHVKEGDIYRRGQSRR